MVCEGIFYVDIEGFAPALHFETAWHFYFVPRCGIDFVAVKICLAWHSELGVEHVPLEPPHSSQIKPSSAPHGVEPGLVVACVGAKGVGVGIGDICGVAYFLVFLKDCFVLPV